MSQSHVDYLLNTGIRDACRPVVYTEYMYIWHIHMLYLGTYTSLPVYEYKNT